jgi:hypothetical protein
MMYVGSAPFPSLFCYVFVGFFAVKCHVKILPFDTIETNQSVEIVPDPRFAGTAWRNNNSPATAGCQLGILFQYTLHLPFIRFGRAPVHLRSH